MRCGGGAACDGVAAKAGCPCTTTSVTHDSNSPKRTTIRRERRPRREQKAARPRLVGETRVDVDDLVAPLFVKEGIDAPEPVTSMPGVLQHTQESLRKE